LIPLHSDFRSTGSSENAHTFPNTPRVSWRRPAGCVLAIIYISLLPFDFSLTAFHRAVADGLWSLQFRPTTTADAVVNLLAYLPVGLVLGLMAMKCRCGRWVGVLAATIVGVMLSILVESLQTGLMSRVASCTDVLLNGVGAAIGACLSVRLSGYAGAAMTQVRSELANHPFTTAASLLTLGLFVYNLAPFDFVTTTDALHASFGRGHWNLMSARDTAIGAPPFAAIAQQLTGAGWFAVLGFLLALSGRERGSPSAMSLGLALKDGLILAALVEFMQLFTRSHTFDTGGILIRSFGVAFGAWCAVFLIDSLTGSAWRRKPGLAVPTGILTILAVFQVGLLIAPCIDPQGVSITTKRPMAVQWLPFETLRQQSLQTAAAEIISSLLIFATLTLTLVVILRRYRVVHTRRWAYALLIILATTCEGLRLATLETPMDMTNLWLAWLSVYLVTSMPKVIVIAKEVRSTITSVAGQGNVSEFPYFECPKGNFHR